MDGTTSQWFAISKYEFTYNNSYSFSDLILPFIFIQDGGSKYYNHMLIDVEFYSWDGISNSWVIMSKDTHSYSEQNVNFICEIDVAEYNIYPNPCSNYVSFNTSEHHGKIILELFDIQGRKVISKEIRDSDKLNMEGLNRGIYFYNLIINGKRMNGKLIKE